MIKVNVFEVSCNIKTDNTFTVKSEMLDLSDEVPSTSKNYVLLTFEEYENLTGKKVKITLKPKRKR